jgi:hypothetical protein
MRNRLAILISAVVFLLLLFLAWHFRSARPAAESPASSSTTASGASTVSPSGAANSSASSAPAPTNVYAHNLMLRKGPDFRIYVRWLRGQMVPTSHTVNPSFDDPESFYLDVKTGVIRANMGDINNFLNATTIPGSPVKNIKLTGDGNQVKLRGTLHKVISVPIELNGTIAALPDNRIQLHITKLSALKIPLTGILGGLNITVSDVFHPQDASGIQVSGNDVFLDTQKLVPPPHIRGQLASVRIINPDLEEIYGNAQEAVSKVEQWRNFLRLSDGTLDFGKLTMRHVDLIMVDLSNDAWFDLDLNHYQDQLVNGYTRMTPQAGLQIFMPDLDEVRQKNKGSQNISLEWLKNRNLPPPPDLVAK